MHKLQVLEVVCPDDFLTAFEEHDVTNAIQSENIAEDTEYIEVIGQVGTISILEQDIDVVSLRSFSVVGSSLNTLN